MAEPGFFTTVLCLQGICNVRNPQTQEELGAGFFMLQLSFNQLSQNLSLSVLGAIILMFV